jgi:hypothetical protein
MDPLCRENPPWEDQPLLKLRLEGESCGRLQLDPFLEEQCCQK